MTSRRAARGRRIGTLAAGLALLLASAVAGPVRATEALRADAADASGTSVSGLSSGAFMAVQFQVAYSAEVVGAGIVAGGPFYCSEGKLALAVGRCMATTAGTPDPAQLVAFARTAAAQGRHRSAREAR
jgi:hypothetical protein